jgi:uncharacterized protein (TIGR00255 family)
MTRLRSMTGFGESSGELSDRLVAHVRVASLNARFLEVGVRTQPRLELADLEAAIRGVLALELTRGRAQVLIDLRQTWSQAVTFQFNWPVAEALARELGGRPQGLELAPLSLRDLLQLPGFAEGGGELGLTDGEKEKLLTLVAEARDLVAADREKEAVALLPQIDGEIQTLAGFVGWLHEVNGALQTTLLARLRERLSKLLEGAGVSEERLLAEAGILADRADVSEEIQRLEAHLGHLRELLGGGGVVGKKLDFLLQELLREVNTAGSKCREAGMGERIVEAKAALEKLREQFANLE